MPRYANVTEIMLEVAGGLTTYKPIGRLLKLAFVMFIIKFRLGCSPSVGLDADMAMDMDIDMDMLHVSISYCQQIIFYFLCRACCYCYCCCLPLLLLCFVWISSTHTETTMEQSVVIAQQLLQLSNECESNIIRSRFYD